MGGEKRLGVPAETEVGVHGHRLRSGQCRSEQLQHAIEHDRNVTTRLTGLVRQRFQPPFTPQYSRIRGCAAGDYPTDPHPCRFPENRRTDPSGQVPIRVAGRGV
ncbi:hypothetical protein Msi02_03080 [Microbispora siamensis]|uniref:Uncharacterized protein n=1 Tax=Microbispora siamensis TaxID=564413 RepID=A0ABQ4GDL7_9ACTN|nr:hypothetical protein Msi02_03080 [Microbispora siamensis]